MADGNKEHTDKDRVRAGGIREERRGRAHQGRPTSGLQPACSPGSL